MINRIVDSSKGSFAIGILVGAGGGIIAFIYVLNAFSFRLCLG
jgi:hypothetical protein